MPTQSSTAGRTFDELTVIAPFKDSFRHTWPISRRPAPPAPGVSDHRSLYLIVPRCPPDRPQAPDRSSRPACVRDAGAVTRRRADACHHQNPTPAVVDQRDHGFDQQEDVGRLDRRCGVRAAARGGDWGVLQMDQQSRRLALH
eukprot:2703281-Prymnesium_polylepis.1